MKKQEVSFRKGMMLFAMLKPEIKRKDLRW